MRCSSPIFRSTSSTRSITGCKRSLRIAVSHGLQIQAAYTWSHALDNSVDPLTPAVGSRTFPRNSRNLAQSYGNSDNDIRNVFVLNYIWDLPFGRGKSYMSHGAIGRIMEGFEVTGIF